MAWLRQRDIDDEKRPPDFVFRLLSRFSPKGVSLEKAEKELKELGIRPGLNVLDFGCGAGHYSIAAGKLVGKEGSVAALDLHPAALEMVEKKAAKHDLANIDTIYSDLETGLSDESVDAVLLFDILKVRKEIGFILKELHRIVKPDGTVFVRSPGLKNGRLEELMVKDGLFHLMGKKGSIFNFTKAGGEFHEI